MIEPKAMAQPSNVIERGCRLATPGGDARGLVLDDGQDEALGARQAVLSPRAVEDFCARLALAAVHGSQGKATNVVTRVGHVERLQIHPVTTTARGASPRLTEITIHHPHDALHRAQKSRQWPIVYLGTSGIAAIPTPS